MLSFERHVVVAGSRTFRSVCFGRAQAASFTNELGVSGTTRFLKNIPGLWLVQECRRDFARQGHEFDYATLTQLASESPTFRTLVDPAYQRSRRRATCWKDCRVCPRDQPIGARITWPIRPMRWKVSPWHIVTNWRHWNRFWDDDSVLSTSSAVAGKTACCVK